MRMGGLGLRSATRCAESAFWASWADALPMIRERTPHVADMVVHAMVGGQPQGCLGELQEASTRLDREGFWWRPSWPELLHGKRPPQSKTGEPGEWQHGWQYWASSISDAFFRKTQILSVRSATCRAHLRSHSGHNAGAALAHAPTAPEYVIPSHLFRTLLLERMQLPLQIDETRCSGCQSPLDALGRHRAACPSTGRLKKRAIPIERVLARVCREAGARVRFNAFMRDMNIGVGATDGRRIEVLAQDLPCFGGAQLAVDVTLRCALTRTGEPHPHAADVDGAVLVKARHDKETTYPELINSGRCRLVVVAIETGGRWSDEAVEFIRLLACAKAQEVPSYMWWPTTLAWQRRWTRMLSTACSLSFAASLVEPSDSCVTWCRTGGEPPSLAELLGQGSALVSWW